MTTRPLTRPVQRIRYRLLAILAGTMLAVWAGASPVLAHNTLTSANPADQEIVQSPPRVVVLTFDDSVIAARTQVGVTAPSGLIQQGQPRLAEKIVPVGGDYIFSFTPKPAATQLPTSPQASPPTTPNQTQPTRMPGWLKLVIGVVAIIFGVRVAQRASRRGNASRP